MGTWYDVRANGSGFVNNYFQVNTPNTSLKINGNPINPAGFGGQPPVYSQILIWINGSLIPTPGTYTIEACNNGTTQGTSCSTGSLTVLP
jgi:hypothetical protein